MSAYSETNFNSQHYDDSRPNYTPQFYKELINYHSEKGGEFNLAVDIGCGSGFVTFELIKYFKNVIGTDPSRTMIDQCNKNVTNKNSIEFLIGTAENQPSKIKPNSVDLITGAECCHWVNHERFYKESARVLKQNGTLAYWFYKDPIFIGYPEANKIYENYTYNSSIEKLGSGYEKWMGNYYQQPGHDYLRSLLKEKSPPNDLYYDVIRHEYIVDRDGVPKNEVDPFKTKTPLFIKKTINMKWFLNYVKSWSAYHAWMKDHGDKYDIAEEFINELKNKLNWNDDTEIEVIWDTVYTFARKRQTRLVNR
ncbi:uncharacterized protein KGF55_004673 [Candida pseudojiufengensis]|uniref:uncharacterized protein n=1 Tax=Candida pseudojiufengensis TaxID=497109 RepID=UPI0022242EFA|nr:uncharacterized protein KGF55_004673 [Candida pseudojiufengensis]KAI5960381.1 hypothetical protein KGF55_004673 [Candida pseudojiufengensis]